MVSPPISVVIPSWNGRAVLDFCLPPLFEALETAGVPQPWDVIVADDDSDDDSVSYLGVRYPRVRVVCHSERRGFGLNVTDGVRQATHDHVLLLNSDVRLAPDFLIHWAPHFADGQMFSLSSRMLLEMTGEFNSGKRVAVWERGLLRHWIVFRVGEVAPTLYGDAGAGVFDRHKFLELGGFDELYSPMYIEDLDLSYRAWKHGWPSVYEPACLAYHLGSHTAEKVFTKRRLALMVQKNSLLFVWRNITDPELIRNHLLWLPLRLAVAPLHRRLWVLALAMALRQAPEALRKRRPDLVSPVHSDRDILALMRPTEEDLTHSPRKGRAGGL